MYQQIRGIFEETLSIPSWLLIDEAQFLTPAQVDQLAHVVDDYGCNVVCYGLRTDFTSHLFEGSRRLFEIADSIEEIKSTWFVRTQDHSQRPHRLGRKHRDRRRAGRDRRQRPLHGRVPQVLDQQAHREGAP